MVCKLPRAASNWFKLRSTAFLASDNCCVIWAKERVRPPSSSLPCSVYLGDKSPAATCRMPSASSNKGRANWLPSNMAIKTAANTAMMRLKVSVPMYILRRPSLAKARSWYSRLADCTSKALATNVAGNSCEICKTQGSSFRLKLFCGTKVSTLMRPFEMPVFSSKPSTISRLSLLRTCLSCAEVGRSGRTANRDGPALAINLPSRAHKTASLASI